MSSVMYVERCQQVVWEEILSPPSYLATLSSQSNVYRKKTTSALNVATVSIGLSPQLAMLCIAQFSLCYLFICIKHHVTVKSQWI